MACHPGWDDYPDLGESVSEMTDCLMTEDAQRKGASPTAGVTSQPTDSVKITPIPPAHTMMVLSTEFPGSATEASATGSYPNKDVDTEDDTAILSHFSDALKEMANSIMGLEDGYYQALCEVIVETKKALRDVSHIDAHYVSRVVTVMSS